MDPINATHASTGKLAPSRLVPRILILIVTLVVSAQGIAQPKAIGPDDIARLQQQTEFSGDWSETRFFDLDRYITIRGTIERLDIPEHPGNVYLRFTVPNPQPLTREKSLESDRLFRATLQSVDVVKFLEIDARDFPQGAEAVIRGWPATDKNFTGSVLLVDDIHLVGSGRTFALHSNNPKMDSKRSNTTSSE